MKSIISALFLFVLIIGSPLTANAQQDTVTIWNIVAEDGNEYHGVIISRNTEEIRLRTVALGTITIQFSEIEKMTSVDPEKIHNGEVWMDNPQEARYFWAPSGYGLRGHDDALVGRKSCMAINLFGLWRHNTIWE